MSKDIFESAVRSKGDYAGVFEYDGEVAYFYFYDLNRDEGKRILDAIPVFTECLNMNEHDIQIKWDQKEENVGLFINGLLLAFYDVTQKMGYGGSYDLKHLKLPHNAEARFDHKNKH